MSSRLDRQLVLLLGLGFAIVVALIWADELLDLPHFLLGATPTPLRLSEAVLESCFVVVLGLVTIALTIRLTRRVAYLESFVVLCAWCRRVRENGEWLTLERFLAVHRSSATHGVCPECAARMEGETPGAPGSTPAPA
jgi:hypothetical protein